MIFFRSLATLLALPPIAATAWADESALTLPPGATATVQLEENASTGFTWIIDTAHSANLDLVAIEDAGSVPTHPDAPGEPPIVGAPRQRSWQVRALHPGHARIVWIYQRSWENLPIKDHSVSVDIADR
jgi:inhibitor of cysteine peptidase